VKRMICLDGVLRFVDEERDEPESDFMATLAAFDEESLANQPILLARAVKALAALASRGTAYDHSHNRDNPSRSISG
jgi:hypothetical protein